MVNDNRSKLTPEQLQVVARWDYERKERQRLYLQLESGYHNPAVILKELQELTPDYCEHNRYVMGTCADCEEIERVLHPELLEDE